MTLEHLPQVPLSYFSYGKFHVHSFVGLTIEEGLARRTGDVVKGGFDEDLSKALPQEPCESTRETSLRERYKHST